MTRRVGRGCLQLCSEESEVLFVCPLAVAEILMPFQTLAYGNVLSLEGARLELMSVR